MLKIRENKKGNVFLLKKIFLLLLYVFVWFACLYVCTTFVSVALRGQKKASSSETEVVDGGRAPYGFWKLNPASSAVVASALKLSHLSESFTLVLNYVYTCAHECRFRWRQKKGLDPLELELGEVENQGAHSVTPEAVQKSWKN